MALPSSGQITLNDIHIEAGGGSGTQASINDSDIRGLIGKSSGTQMAFSEWYGASASSLSFASSGNWYNTGLGTSANPYNGSSLNTAHNSSGNIYFDVIGTLTVTINAQVSSEANYDWGYLYIGSTLQWQISGSNVRNGTYLVSNQQIRLSYTKDGSVSAGSDALFHTNISA